MVGELSQVCLIQMVLPELVRQVPVVLVVHQAQRAQHQEWAGRVVLQQPVRVLVPQGQVEEGRTKEVYQKQVLQVQAVECQAQEEEPSPRVLEVVEGCPLNRLQKMEVGAGLDYSLLHQ